MGCDYLGISPIVKRIWTPGWVLLSGGICLIVLAVLYAIIDLAKWKKWAFPFIVVGVNPITFYILSWTLVDAINSNLSRHLGPSFFKTIAGDTFGPLLGTICMVTTLWLIVYWMYKRKVYVRI
jgi:predicted acyltransferase